MSGAREQKIDALKCVAMAFVIVGHAIVHDNLFSVAAPTRVALGAQWIERATLNSLCLNVAYSFHMPLFAFLSAYVLFGREGSPAKLIGKRALSLLLPYTMWVGISYAFGAQTGWSWRAGALYVGQRLVDPSLPGAAWFLYGLFGCFVVFAAVRALGGRDRMLVTSVVLVGGIVVLPFPAGQLRGAHDLSWLYPFFVMGYLFAKHAGFLRERRAVLMWGGAVLWTVLLPVIWPVLAPEVNWWYPDLREALRARNLPGAAVIYWAARYACAAAAISALFYAYDSLRGWPRAAQAWAGRRTLGMYVIQPYLFLFLAAVLAGNVFLLAIAVFAGSLMLTWIFEQGSPTRLLLLGQRTAPRTSGR